MAKVLVVDDKPEICVLLRAALERKGHTVLVAATAGQAWDLLAERPDVIYADVGLPDEDGIEMVTRMRREPGLARFPVVFVTANSEVVRIIKDKVEEPMAILEKPFRLEQVGAKLHEVFNQQDE